MRPRLDTLLVWTGAPCTYGCPACPIEPAAAAAGIAAAELQRGLAAVPDCGGRLVVLVGGEPFLRADLPRLIATIRAAGCAPGVVTTGRSLVYPHVRERMHRLGLAFLRVQLFGVGDAHDRAVAVGGAFEHAMEGVRAWLAETAGGCDVDVALTVRARSLDGVVDDAARLAREISSPHVQIVIAVDRTDAAAAPDEGAIRRAVAALAAWNDDATRPLLAWEGVPASAAAGAATATLLRPAFVGAAAPRCCLGRLAGRAEADPLAAPRATANSFNFVDAGVAVPRTGDAETCSADRAAATADPIRQLWLVEGDRLRLYVTDTGDFAPAEIARIKNELSHLFVDRAAPGVLDDFIEGMRRVMPDAICAACARRAGCGRRFRVVEGPPFAREEAWIAGYIARLRGRVLDVGCGEQLYRAELEPLVRSGAVRYTGLDPDELSLARLRAALPKARFHAGGIEDFRGTPASYDRILCLRSFNHVFDPDEAMARMADLLAPGGELLMVETTPFAMLRSAEQVAAADRAPRAGHQHFRNVASDAVLPLARRHGLHVVHHQPIGRAATNQWILLLARR